ncbi:MAG: hypothetical protein WD470_03195, partial [Rhodospirillaceae bacterium]
MASSNFVQVSSDPFEIGGFVEYALSISEDLDDVIGLNPRLSWDADVLTLVDATFQSGLLELSAPPLASPDLSGPQTYNFSGGLFTGFVPTPGVEAPLITFRFEIKAEGESTVALSGNGTDAFIARQAEFGDPVLEVPAPAPLTFEFSSLDPNDIDGDGLLNTDDPFAFDGSNGLDRVLLAGSEFTQDFNTDTTDPFDADGGFTGILVNPAFDYGNPADPAADPYGNRTNEAGVSIAGGTLNILSTETDAFNNGGTGTNNTLADGYQSAVDVSGVDQF